MDASDNSSWHSGGSFQSLLCVHMLMRCVFNLAELTLYALFSLVSL